MNYSKISDSVVSQTRITIDNIQREYLKDSLPWSLAYSGGKDSSALLKLVYLALEELHRKSKLVTVIYCDTGVEIPIIRTFVIRTLENLSNEAVENNIPIRTRIVYPPIKDRFFSKVIGRGYPPPTFKFRWCTDVLRIRPIRRFLKNQNEQCIVLLGVRKGESFERDRIISRHETTHDYYYRQSGNKNALIYSPIIGYNVSDVWSILNEESNPRSIDTEKLQILYSVLNSENANSLKSSNVSGAKGRFGCWTCTVVRRDKAVENLIQNGEKSLESLFEFRNWLAEIRYDTSYRLKTRRNGNKGIGPFTVEARKEILSRLLKAQCNTTWNLITDEEIEYIRGQWLLDSQ
ncbi:hypothetical protein ES703_06448 [subsurface metagenome]